MRNRSLAGVALRLEDAITGLPVQATNTAELFDLYEEMAIQVLDSEYASYPADTLEMYLRLFLRMKRLELGLAAFPEPGGD